MRKRLAIILIVATLFGAGYWYYTAQAVCAVPIVYHVGAIPASFSLAPDTARNAALQAEALWEDATGLDLFTYSETEGLPIDFVFDDRQQNTNAELVLREILEAKQDRSDDVQKQYADLLAKYDTLKRSYEEQTQEYEERLNAHNEEVEEWNEAGGAPADIYGRLNKEQKVLKEEQARLSDIADQLNTLVDRMNQIGARGNSIIGDYNEIVEEYNNQFSESSEFTQGDYQGDAIHIYQYDSYAELVLVLAHEFGHALSLGHVEGEDAIMYHLMEEQSLNTGVTLYDTAEFERVCGTDRVTWWSAFTGLAQG
ncbi:matrixin family metalloprotease [Candidatus Kaiserbacteria bacterium]|nr:matrixin family metalloprotease [Candidatus Kaiserbacteria bacterium]